MKNKNKILLFGLIIILILFLLSYIVLGKKGIGLIIDKGGVTKNIVQVNVDEGINKDSLYIYWLGEIGGTTERNKLMIYKRGEVKLDIPPSYGKNWFLVRYKDKSYDKIGIVKLESYSKHNYKFNFKMNNNNLIIDWKISNWYDTEIHQGRDTLKLN